MRDKTGSHKITGPQKHRRAEINPGINSTLIQTYNQPFEKDGQNEKTTKERCKSRVDNGDKQRLRKIKERNHGSTVSGAF